MATANLKPPAAAEREKSPPGSKRCLNSVLLAVLLICRSAAMPAPPGHFLSHAILNYTFMLLCGSHHSSEEEGQSNALSKWYQVDIMPYTIIDHTVPAGKAIVCCVTLIKHRTG